MKKGYLASFPCVTYECMFLNMLHSLWTRERTGMFADLKTSHNCANSVSTLLPSVKKGTLGAEPGVTDNAVNIYTWH